MTEIIVTTRLSGNIRQIIAAKSTEMYELTSGRAEIFTAKMSDDGLTANLQNSTSQHGDSFRYQNTHRGT